MSDDSARGVLVSRPEPGASDTAARLRALGWRPVLAPVLRIETRPVEVRGHVQAVLVTSGNAIPGLPDSLRGETMLTVGDATAARARAAGFADVRSAGADAAALAELARAQCEPEEGALLLACGAGQGETLAELLRADGFRVLRRVSYAAMPATTLPPQALAALEAGEVAAALVFSPESGRRLVSLLKAAAADVRGLDALAISHSAAAGLAPLPWRRIRVASHPDQDALLGLLP